MSLTQAWQALSWQAALLVVCTLFVLAVWIATLVAPKKRGATLRAPDRAVSRSVNTGSWT